MSAPLAFTVLALIPWPAGSAKIEDGVENRAPVDFAREVRPILSDKCFQCHGPDPETREAGLRVDSLAGITAELSTGGHAVVAGNVEDSELLYRIAPEFEDDLMPPERSGKSLSESERSVLRRWIEEGAPWDEHWSFQRPIKPLVADGGDGQGRSDIDALLDAPMAAAGLSFQPEADAATLQRRVSLDLIGLPPTLEASAAFEADVARRGLDVAYRAEVRRLLDSERYGVHMARIWLDAARYADTHGLHLDNRRSMWPYRDWVVQALNENKPFDEFVVEQLAGDLLPNATVDQKVASGFNRCNPTSAEGGMIAQEYLSIYAKDRADTTAKVFLGLTLECAQCHDHKFDPITQRDYFGLFALFDGIDESGLYSHFTNATPTPTLELPTEVQERKTAELEGRISAALTAVDGEALPWREALSTSFADAGEEGAPFQLRGGARVTADRAAEGVELDGENSVVFPGVGVFRRADPFRIQLELRSPEAFERAVVLHRTKSWTDSGSRGYQLLVDEGRLLFALVHFWPGDAVAVRTVSAMPVGQWTNVELRYDGSSRASGMEIWVDGAPAALEVVRDHLTRTIRGGSIEHLTIGSRFRDRGFKGGAVRSMRVLELPPEIPNPTNTLRAARAALNDHRDRIRLIMTMREAPDLPAARRTAHVLGRGLYSNRGEAVGPATPAFLPALLDEPVRSRLDLARWLTHPDHPLTARVHVDRLWRLTMGQGLVPSPEDLGSQSRPPAHAELLDTLARDLIDSSWDSRAMLRRIVLSSTYRQVSDHAESFERDPGNELLSRASTRRMSAEVIRDAALESAGLLVHRVGGPAVRPYQPPGLWQEKSGKVYRAGRGDELHRRSLYTFWRRTSPPPAMTMFDAPAREVCRVDRPATTTPLQALVLWNDPQFVEVSLALAQLALEDGRLSPPGLSADEVDQRRVEFIIRSLTSRPPTTAERESMTTLLAAQRAAYRQDPASARQLAGYSLERAAHPDGEAPDQPPMGEEIAVETAATAVVASALLGLPDVVQRR